MLHWILVACGPGRIEIPAEVTPPIDPSIHLEIPAPTGPVQASELVWRPDGNVSSLVRVGWTQSGPASVRVEYSFDDGVWESTPTAEYGAGTWERVLAGIPFGTSATWRVVLDEDAVVDGGTLTTGPLPPGLPVARITTSDPDRWDADGKYLLASINQEQGGWVRGTFWTFLMDRKGRMVWAHPAPQKHWTLFAQLSPAGDAIVWDEQTYWSEFHGGQGSTVHRWKLDRELEEIATPGLHHAFVELPDGTIAWGAKDFSEGEVLMEKPPGEAEGHAIWSCGRDWLFIPECESNGLYYHEPTDSYLYSFYTNNSVVEVDRALGSSRWWAGDAWWGYRFDPSGTQFTWQHGVSYTDTGTLLLSSSFEAGGAGIETWLLEYGVDHKNNTLHLMWADSAGIRAETNGQAWRLPGGNTLHLLGSASIVREVEPGGDDVWVADFEGTRLLGQGEMVRDLYGLLDAP